MTEPDLWRELAEIRDPELPVSIIDLGLVYGVRVSGGRIDVDLTLTSMGCPCTDWIIEDVQNRLAGLPGIMDVHVTLVWDPPWTLDRISAPGRAALAAAGISA
jgi:metal-sulfur cluster biosynthetic enzyme